MFYLRSLTVPSPPQLPMSSGRTRSQHLCSSAAGSLISQKDKGLCWRRSKGEYQSISLQICHRRQRLASYNFNHLFAFTTDSLIPTLLSSLFLDLAQKLIVEGFQIDKNFVRIMLGPALIAARHTSIVHIIKNGPGSDTPVSSFKYVWAHREMQPWGRPKPAQCSKCKSFRSWGARLPPNNLDGGAFRCEAVIKNQVCHNVFVSARPSNISLQVGDWIIATWPANEDGAIW